jgi:uncharacterized protein YcsI (UPF0317 family)
MTDLYDRRTTSGLSAGMLQANLIIVPHDYAAEMRQLCERNPVSCPLVEELPRGSYEPLCAPGTDIRTHVPAYRIWRDGELVERTPDVTATAGDDMVAFLIGCSFSFESALVDAGLPIRHQELGRNVPMYRTNHLVAPAGRLRGALVVSMRPYPSAAIERVRDVTRPHVNAHGEPLWWGDPAVLGIADIDAPDEGDAVTIRPGEIPVFWACGVTTQSVAIASRVPLVITHEPGQMFVTTRRAG